jgi:hypothetical protein
MVEVSVSPGVSAYLMSAPTVAVEARAFPKGSAAATGCVDRFATAYGASSSLRAALASFSPVSSPNSETKPGRLFDRSGHVEVSLRRPISRTTAKPNTSSLPGRKRSCENGMRNSALHPRASRATETSHTASQLESLLVSANRYRSSLTPAGLTPNSYAVRRS